MPLIQIKEHDYSAEQIGYHSDSLIEIAVFQLVSIYGWGLIYKYFNIPHIWSRRFNDFRSLADSLDGLGYGDLANICSANARDGAFFDKLCVPTLEPELINKVVVV